MKELFLNAGDVMNGKSEIKGMRDEAFCELVSSYMPAVSRISYRILCDRPDSESVSCDVFMKVWRNPSGYDDVLRMDLWIYRIVCRMCIGRLRWRGFQEILSIRRPVYELSSPEALTPEEDYITRESWDIYCRASRNLSPRQRAVYVLMELEGLSVDEASYVLGMTAGRVEEFHAEAVARIKEELGFYGEVR